MDYPKLKVFNSKFELQGYIDAYSSLIWTVRFRKYGDFELCVPAQKRLVKLLETGNILVRDPKATYEIQDEYYGMIIERVEIQQEAENADMLIVSGRSLESILYRRVMYDDVVTGYHCDISLVNTRSAFLKHLIDHCFNIMNINMTEGNTQYYHYSNPVPRYWLREPTPGRTPQAGDIAYTVLNNTWENQDSRVRVANKNDNLGETLEQLLTSYGYGIEVTYSPSNDFLYVIRILKTNDKSDEVIFRSDLDNLANCNYIKDTTEYANCCRISAPQKNGLEGNITRTISAPQNVDSVRQENTDYWSINRYETVFDTDLIGDRVDMDDALYESAKRQLAKLLKNTEIQGDIISTKTYTMGIDYVLGDIVKVVTDWGISATAQIIEYTESWSTEGYTCYPTFDNYNMFEPEIEPEQTKFTNSVMITMSIPNTANIKYTLDGTDPTASNGIIYTGPFVITKTTTIKACTFLGAGTAMSRIVVKTYEKTS